MIDLEKARVAASTLADNAPIQVTGRWLKQAISEIEAGRSAITEQKSVPGPLDHNAAGVKPSDFATVVDSMRAAVRQMERRTA